jgi:hypothetical protein
MDLDHVIELCKMLMISQEESILCSAECAYVFIIEL